MLPTEHRYMKRKRKVEIEYTIVPLSELSSEDRALVEQAKEARFTAHAPYSKFQVGAAALLANGLTVMGSNQENRAFPSGLCAERVCLFYASSQYPQVAVQKLAVVAFPGNSESAEPAHPCGSCRQVMLEVEHKHAQSFQLLLLYPKDEVLMLEKANFLMPFPFESDI